MKRFPFSRLRPKLGSITASLHYNPYSDLPPTVWYTIKLEIEPLELGSSAAEPDYEKVVDAPIIFDGLRFKHHQWNALTGTYKFHDEQNGSFYVTSAHNPVDVCELKLQFRDGATYDVKVLATFHFEYEGAGYADETTRLVFAAVHRGFIFHVPRWNEPEKVRFPASWKIPSTVPDWPPDTIRQFVQRYFDITQFTSLKIENGVLHAEPSPPK